MQDKKKSIVKELEGLILDIASDNECIDKFGDILLRYDCDDVGLFAQALIDEGYRRIINQKIRK